MGSLRNFTRPNFINATIDNTVYLPSVDRNKAITERFVIKFESCLASRGESVNHALLSLRAKGFILHRSSLNRWKRGLLPGFNSLQFDILANYAGFTLAQFFRESDLP